MGKQHGLYWIAVLSVFGISWGVKATTWYPWKTSPHRGHR